MENELSFYGESPLRKLYPIWLFYEEMKRIHMRYMLTFGVRQESEIKPVADKPVIVSGICGSKKD